MDIEFVKKIAVAASLLGIIVGLGLLLKPDWIQRTSHQSARWVTLRKATKALDKPIDIDPWVIRNGRIVGILFLLVSLFIMFRILFI